MRLFSSLSVAPVLLGPEGSYHTAFGAARSLRPSLGFSVSGECLTRAVGHCCVCLPVCSSRLSLSSLSVPGVTDLNACTLLSQKTFLESPLAFQNHDRKVGAQIPVSCPEWILGKAAIKAGAPGSPSFAPPSYGSTVLDIPWHTSSLWEPQLSRNRVRLSPHQCPMLLT